MVLYTLHADIIERTDEALIRPLSCVSADMYSGSAPDGGGEITQSTRVHRLSFYIVWLDATLIASLWSNIILAERARHQNPVSVWPV